MSVISILVVEDNPGDAQLIRYSLEEVGRGEIRIRFASTLADAKLKLLAERFDAVLLDLSLPDSVGINTVNEAIATRDDVPVIVLSGLSDEDVAVQAVQAGAQDYLVKGYGDGPLIRRAILYAIERHKSEQDMRLAETVFTTADSAIMVTDSKGRIVRINGAFTSITGFDAEDVAKQTAAMLRCDVHDDEFYAEVETAIAASDHWEGEAWSRRKNGEVYPLWLRVNAVRNKANKVTHRVYIFTDITYRKQMENQLVHQATHDTLTGLPNRHLFTDRLTQALAMASRKSQGVALLFLDLDGFKAVNDRLGHAAGDQLLIMVAQRLRHAVRASDTVARLAGDEFTVILSDIECADGEEMVDAIAAVAEKLVAVTGQPYHLDLGEAHVSASIGIAIFPSDAQDVDRLIIAADVAMYAAKRGGKNTYRFHDRALCLTPGAL